MLRLVSKIHDLSINPMLERGSADDLLARCRRWRRNKGSCVDRKDRLHNKIHRAQKVKFLKYFRVERFSLSLSSPPPLRVNRWILERVFYYTTRVPFEIPTYLSNDREMEQLNAENGASVRFLT